MKKLINAPETVVDEMCAGIVRVHSSQLDLNKKYRIISRKHKNADKVALISGGGSGHEPAHAGFVGEGMLDAAICGDVFASPSTIQVYNGILECQNDQGILLIIKNYSGDIMNFEAAAEMAEDDDINVEKVYVNDDIAVKDSLYTVGRRGVAGTIYVHKILGAAAEEGKSLEELKLLSEKVIPNIKSLGFAFTSCTVPAKGSPTFQLEEDEMEFGVGIHGEPGIAKQKIKSADEIAQDIVDRIDAEMPLENEEVAVLVNGLGATPLQELYLFTESIAKVLEEKKVNVAQFDVGNYMTAIDMAGASVSIIKLDSETKQYLQAEADTPAMKV